MKCPKCRGYLRPWYDRQEYVGLKCDDCQFEIKPVEQCFCQSYVDDNGVLQDCTCGKCANLIKTK